MVDPAKFLFVIAPTCWLSARQAVGGDAAVEEPQLTSQMSFSTRRRHLL